MQLPFPSTENLGPAFRFKQRWYLPWRRGGGMVTCPPVSHPHQTHVPACPPARGQGYSPFKKGLECLVNAAAFQDGKVSSHFQKTEWTSGPQ